jgi:hypothetical protein
MGDPRRTVISQQGADDLDEEDMVPDDPMVIMLSHKGYIKRLSVDTWQSQNRGGRGKTGVITREEDFLDQVFTATNHTYILFFTNQGRCYWLKVFRIPEAGRNTLGKALVNLVELKPGERPVARVCVGSFSENAHIAMVTSEGRVKKSPLVFYSRPRRGGIKAVKLDEGSELVSALMTTGEDNLLIGTARGKAIHFSEKEIRPMSRDTFGVRGITLARGDRVVGMTRVTPGDRILTVTENGFGKVTPSSAYRMTHRGGMGIINISTVQRNGDVVVVGVVSPEDELLLVSAGGLPSDSGPGDVREIGRNTMGVKLMSLSEGDRVSDAAILSPESLRRCGENGGNDRQGRPEAEAGHLAVGSRRRFRGASGDHRSRSPFRETRHASGHSRNYSGSGGTSAVPCMEGCVAFCGLSAHRNGRWGRCSIQEASEDPVPPGLRAHCRRVVLGGPSPSRNLWRLGMEGFFQLAGTLADKGSSPGDHDLAKPLPAGSGC